MKTDSELLRRTAGGDSDAFAELYNRYKSELYCYTRALVKDTGIAEDVIHDTFLRLFKAGHTLRNPDSLRPWLYTIVRRLSYDALRWSRNTEQLSDEEPCTELTPLESTEQNDSHSVLQNALEGLPASYREVIFLREYLQLSYDEMCDLTGATLPAIKSRLFKARKALSVVLESYFLA